MNEHTNRTQDRTIASRHICGTIWKSSKFTVHRKTVGKRMTAKLHDIAAKLRRSLGLSPNIRDKSRVRE